MGMQSRCNNNTLEHWQRLARKPNLSPEFAHQIRRNIREKTADLEKRTRPRPAAVESVAPPRESFFKRFVKALGRPFNRKPADYKGANNAR